MRRTIVLPLLLLAAGAAGCADGASGLTEPVTEVVDAFDGEQFGFLTEVSTDPAGVVIDPATWVESDDEPNGYRIDDPGVAPVELAIADDAVIEVFTSTGDPATATNVTVAELADWLAGLSSPETEAAFNVVVVDGELIEMRFVYRP
ncbi:MAG: hypothetical protein KY461_06945 [Actinobacteria bacterium]|nr:hypothetical protein [Actinomycetota bacterium]